MYKEHLQKHNPESSVVYHDQVAISDFPDLDTDS